jgi:3-oxoadipate enol-lactonase
VGELVPTSRGDFFVERTGPSPASVPVIVFVAGLGDDHHSWDDVMDRLKGRYHCVTFDNRGIGRSPVTPGPYSIVELSEDVHELVSILGLGPVIAVGSSMGGAICQEWALAHPEAVTTLILTNTWAERDVWVCSLLDHWIELAEQRQDRYLLHQLALYSFSPEFLAGRPETVAEFLTSPVPDPAGVAAAARGCQAHHTLERLAAINTPTLVIGGERDILTRPALSHDLAEAIPSAELQWLPAGHMTFWEAPTPWLELVTEFLARRDITAPIRT